MWGFFDPSWLSPNEINRVSILLVLWGLVVLLMLQRRLAHGAWLPACCAMLAWFFFVNKVYSPQYGLWTVAMFAVIGAAPALAVAWSAIALLYFGTQFVLLELAQYGDAHDWFMEHASAPAVVLREGMLLVVVGWCLYQMSASERGEPAQEEDRGEQRASKR